MCINNNTAGIFFWRLKNFFATSKIFLFPFCSIIFQRKTPIISQLAQFSLLTQYQDQLLDNPGEPKERRKPFACLCPLCPPSSLWTGETQWLRSLPRAKRWQVRSPNSSVLWLSRQQSHCCLYVGIPPANVLFPSILIETHWRLHKNRNYCF